MSPWRPESIQLYVATHHPLTDELASWYDYERFAAFLQDRAHPPVSRIVDIGCAYGAQAVLFSRWAYLGIAHQAAQGYGPDPAGQVRTIPFFSHPSVTTDYLITHCPDLDFEPKPGDCFIANLSLGYEPHPDTPEDIAKGLSRFVQGFFHGPPAIHEALGSVFWHRTQLWDAMIPMIGYPHGFHSVAVWYTHKTA